jgi:adenine-specific DNA-methyltransferase
METQYEKLKKILRQMFQLDQADLDFGIYRIMNQKRDEIEQFLDEELLPQVKDEFSRYKSADAGEKKNELDRLERTVKESGLNPDDSPKVKELRKQLAEYGDEESLVNEVFSHLTTFFSRYYDGGDFLSLRRYKKDTYAIPYEGEEIKLYWANADQYYIKSSEYLKDYVFKINGDKRIHFKLVDATEEKDNIKQEQGKERKFKLYEDEPIKVEDNELYIQFTYLSDKAKQAELNKKTVEYVAFVFSDLTAKGFQDIYLSKPTQKNPKRTLFEKNLNDYTARFNFDFFIHKDLGGFLRRELDFYIKNEVLFIDDLDVDNEKKVIQSIGKVKVLKHIAQKIIYFLSQLEDFQKKMWLKKKFVVDCGYCATLDRVPNELYEEIAGNDVQREEWVRLFAINEIEEDLMKPAYSEPLSKKFLEANPYLVVDTKYYSDEFKEKLLASLGNIDDECDGVIINSENFQANNLLQNKYTEKINCIYIDPPFNSPSSEIIYKNNYKHSSWLSLMYDRILLAKRLSNDSGSCIVAIDENEQNGLFAIIKNIYPDYDTTMVSIEHNKKGIQGAHFSFTNEFSIFSISQNVKNLNRVKRDKEEWEYSNFRNWGGESLRTDAKNCFYPVFVQDDSIIDFGDVCDDNFHPDSANIERDGGIIEVYPIDSEGIERKWRNARNTVKGATDLLKIEKNRDGLVEIKKAKADDQFKTMWYSPKYNAGDYGTKLLTNLGISRNLFSFPKSIHTVKDCIFAVTNSEDIVLDYFAGSGTSGHAVINLNREDDGKRKYILVEMGKHFDTVLKPRIQKVVYSKDWKGGKPVSREGISHIFKYMKLESYEDTLDNLIVKLNEKQQKALDMSKATKEDYMLGYMLDIETRESDSLLNIDKFADPFNYTLKIRDDNELKTTKIDLIETFNYLIGLYVEQTEVIRGFKVIRGRLRTGKKTLVIWRNTNEKSNKELDNFFTKQKYNTQDFEFDRIFVNGDNNLENLKVEEDRWKVSLIEEEFKRRMFDVRDS